MIYYFKSTVDIHSKSGFRLHNVFYVKMLQQDLKKLPEKPVNCQPALRELFLYFLKLGLSENLLI